MKRLKKICDGTLQKHKKILWKGYLDNKTIEIAKKLALMIAFVKIFVIDFCYIHLMLEKYK